MKKARISDLVDTSLYYASVLAFNLTVNLGKALIKAVLRGQLLAGGSMKGCGTGRHLPPLHRGATADCCVENVTRTSHCT